MTIGLWILYQTRNSKANTTTIKLFRGYDKALDERNKLNRRSKKNERWIIGEKKVMVY